MLAEGSATPTVESLTPSMLRSLSPAQPQQPIMRNGVLDVSFTELGSLGFRLLGTDAGIIIKGKTFNAMVSKVAGAALRAGVEDGMLVAQINGKRTDSVSASSAMSRLAEVAAIRPLQISFVRAGGTTIGSSVTLATQASPGYSGNWLNKHRFISSNAAVHTHTRSHMPGKQPPPPRPPALTSAAKIRMRTSIGRS